MATTLYLNCIRRAKHAARLARARRLLAYHLDMGVHGMVDPIPVAPGWYHWYPTPVHRGWLVEAAALSIASAALSKGYTY